MNLNTEEKQLVNELISDSTPLKDMQLRIARYSTGDLVSVNSFQVFGDENLDVMLKLREPCRVCRLLPFPFRVPVFKPDADICKPAPCEDANTPQLIASFRVDWMSSPLGVALNRCWVIDLTSGIVALRSQSLPLPLEDLRDISLVYATEVELGKFPLDFVSIVRQRWGGSETEGK